MKIMITLLAVFALASCAPREEPKPKVAFDTLEQARAQAKENAEKNATIYRSKNPAVANLAIYSRGDSTQTNECPQGDGWATMDLQDTDGKVVQRIKCSTVSQSLSCLEDKDFKTKIYADEDNHCQPVEKVPFPLPKLSK